MLSFSKITLRNREKKCWSLNFSLLPWAFSLVSFQQTQRSPIHAYFLVEQSAVTHATSPRDQ